MSTQKSGKPKLPTKSSFIKNTKKLLMFDCNFRTYVLNYLCGSSALKVPMTRWKSPEPFYKVLHKVDVTMEGR